MTLNDKLIRYGFIASVVITALVYFIFDYKNKKLVQVIENTAREALKGKLNQIDLERALGNHNEAQKKYLDLRARYSDMLKQLGLLDDTPHAG